MGLGRDGVVGRTTRGRRRVIVVAAVLAVGGLVAGCGPERAGSAAIVGDARITDMQLSDQVNVVTAALGIPTSAKANHVVFNRPAPTELYTRLSTLPHRDPRPHLHHRCLPTMLLMLLCCLVRHMLPLSLMHLYLSSVRLYL